MVGLSVTPCFRTVITPCWSHIAGSQPPCPALVMALHLARQLRLQISILGHALWQAPSWPLGVAHLHFHDVGAECLHRSIHSVPSIPGACYTDPAQDLNWLEVTSVTKYQVTNRKRAPTNGFRENEQKTVLPTQNKVSPSQEKSALPDMSSCLCCTELSRALKRC